MSTSVSINQIVVYIAVLIAIVIGLLLWKKVKTNKKKLGCMSAGMGFTGLFIVSLFFCFCVVSVSKSFYAFSNFTKYDAKVVDMTSHYETTTTTDNEGNRQTRTTLMYTAVLRFTNDQGNEVNMPNNISSSGKPKIGSIITVAYQNDELKEYSFRARLMDLGVALFAIIFGNLLLYLFFYAIGRDTSKLKYIGGKFLMLVIIPFILLGFTILFIVGFFNFFYDPEFNIFVMLVLLFFCIVMVFVSFGYIKMVFVNKETDQIIKSGNQMLQRTKKKI